MIETLIGSALGGIFRLVPETLKWLDRKDERKHELAMFDKQLQADELRAKAQLQQTQAEVEGKIGLAEIEGLITATKAQGKQTGIGWVDAINTLMRPIITFWWVIVLQTTALICSYISLRQTGISGLDAVAMLWGPDERAIVASIISFWFVDRALRKGGGVGVKH